MPDTGPITYVRVEQEFMVPAPVEPGRDTGYIYMVPGQGYVSQAGFYSGTWSAWTLLGSFVGEFPSRKAAAEALIAARRP
jgi:hypothetical protein